MNWQGTDVTLPYVLIVDVEVCLGNGSHGWRADYIVIFKFGGFILLGIGGGLIAHYTDGIQLS